MDSRPARLRRLVASGLAGLMMLTACTGDDSPRPVVEGAGEKGETDPDGVLRYGIDFEPNFTDTFDPAASLGTCDRINMQFIYDTLVRADKEGNLLPGLAESWDADGDTLTLHLRHGVVFHDGTPFDAAAVKAGLEHNKEGVQTSPELAVLEEIEVVDDHTLRLSLRRPIAAVFPFTLTGREGMIMAPSALEAGTAGEQPVGAGPYEFREYVPGSRLSLRRFEQFWNPDEQGLGGIDFVHVGVGPPAVSALLSDSLDMASWYEESRRVLEPNEAISTDTTQSLDYVQLQFRVMNPPLDDVRVRRAINHAVDRNITNDVVLGGDGVLAWMPYPEGHIGYDPDSAERYPYDPDRARELLAEAGHPDGFSLDIVIPGGVIWQQRQAELLQQQLGEVGIDISLIPSTEIAAEYYLQRVGDGFSAVRPSSPDPVAQIEAQWGKGQFVAAHNGAEHDEIHELVRAAQAAPDVETMGENLRAASAIVVEEALELAIAFQPRHVAWDHTRVGGHISAPPDTCTPADLSGAFMLAR